MLAPASAHQADDDEYEHEEYEQRHDRVDRLRLVGTDGGAALPFLRVAGQDRQDGVDARH